MMQNINIVDVIKTIVSEMRYTGAITSIDTITGGYKANVNKTYDIFVGEKIMIGTIKCTVTAVVSNKSISFTSASKPTESTYTCLAPYFYHGVATSVNDDRLIDLEGNKMKYPFISLFEPIESVFNPNDGNNIQETASLWLIFMTESDYANWSTDTHYTSAINYCQNLMLRFVQCVKDSRSIAQFDNIEEYTMIRHAKYGLVSKNSGHVTELLKDNISGVEIPNFKISIIKKYESC